MKSKKDIYKIITERFIIALKGGKIPWRKTWKDTGLPKNLISKNGSKKGLTDKIKLLTEKNVQLEDEIKQFQQDRKIAKPFVDDLNVHNPIVLSGIALLLGLFIGIILMDWRARRRHGGLRF